MHNHLPPYVSQILNIIYRTVLIFILVYFEWCDTENQQYSGAILVCYTAIFSERLWWRPSAGLAFLN